MLSLVDAFKKVLLRNFAKGGVTEVVAMREAFGPESSFSITVPEEWLDQSREDALLITAPDDHASLGGGAWLLGPGTTLSQFAHARFEGVKAMALYREVGDEYQTSGNGTVREYEGVWPGERKKTTYLVACLNKNSVFVAVSLTIDQKTYRKKKAFYDKIIDSVRVA